MKPPRPGRLLACASALALLGLAAFVTHKTRTVALELVAPPFYKPQPLARVEATFEDLAKGDGRDPGGTWESRPVGALEVWRLRRPGSAPRAVVLLLHGFGDARWGTSPALRWFPDQDAAIFTYLGRDTALRQGRPDAPFVTFGALESRNVADVVHDLEAQGTPRSRIILMGRSLGASVGLLALARLEAEGRGGLGGIIWEGAPASSRSFAERLVRGPRDRFWHPFLAPAVGDWGSRWAAHMGAYRREETDLSRQLGGSTFETPSLCFLATQDRLADPEVQAWAAGRFRRSEVVRVPTWHLNCSPVLGGAYARHIQEATRRWLGSPERSRN